MSIKRGNLRATKKWHKSEARPGGENGYGLVTFELGACSTKKFEGVGRSRLPLSRLI